MESTRSVVESANGRSDQWPSVTGRVQQHPLPHSSLVPQSVTCTRLCLRIPWMNVEPVTQVHACLTYDLCPVDCRACAWRCDNQTLWGCSCFGGYRCVGTGVGVRGTEGSVVQKQDTGHVRQAAWLDKVTIVFVVLNTRVAGCLFTTGFESPPVFNFLPSCLTPPLNSSNVFYGFGTSCDCHHPVLITSVVQLSDAKI